MPTKNIENRVVEGPLSGRPDRKKYAIQAVDNALKVLDALSDIEGEVKLTRLSEKVSLDKSNLFRLLVTFEKWGYVEQVQSTGKYRLGLKAFEISQKLLGRMGLLQKARPAMDRLVRECNETIYLAVPSGDDVLFLDMVDTTQLVRIKPLVGMRYPMSATAAGKIMLAFNQKWREGDLKELEAVCQRGATIGHDCLGEGTTCVAVPLLTGVKEVSGSLCLVGPKFRCTSERIDIELLPLLKEAAEAISAKLGHVEHLRKM